MTSPAPSYEQQLKARYAVAIANCRAAPTAALKLATVHILPKPVNKRTEPPMWQIADVWFDAHVTAFNEKDSPRGYIKRMAFQLGMSRKEFLTNKRRDIAFMRQEVMAELQQQFGLSSVAIGHLMGMDHATILYGLRKMEYLATEEGKRETEANQERLAIIKAEVENGASFASIGRKLDMGSSTIAHWARRYGWKPIAKKAAEI